MDCLKKNLKSDIQKLAFRTEKLLLESDSVNSIDVDLLLDMTKRFYEHVLELRDTCKSVGNSSVIEKSEEQSVSEVEFQKEELRQNAVEESKINEELLEAAFERKRIDPEYTEQKNPVSETAEAVRSAEEKIKMISEWEQSEKGIITEDPFQTRVDFREITREITPEKIVAADPGKEFIPENPSVLSVEHIVSEEEKKTDEPAIEEKEFSCIEEKFVEESPQKEEKVRSELFDYLALSNAASTQSSLFAENTQGATVADRFQQSNNQSVLDKISSAAEQGNAERHFSQAVKDIRQIIGINEKFLFINELFSGNMKEYNDFILTLNDIQSTEEAKDYLAEVEKKKGWNTHSLAFMNFLKIVGRKFI